MVDIPGFVVYDGVINLSPKKEDISIMSTIITPEKHLLASEVRAKLGTVYFEGEDSTTPEEHYIIVGQILGSAATYLIHKETDALLGGIRHINRTNELLAYASNTSLVGGYYVSSNNKDGFAGIFREIIKASKFINA